MRPHVLVFDLDDTLLPEADYVRSGFAAVDAWVGARLGRAGFAEAAWAIHAAGHRGDVFDRALAALGLPVDGATVAAMVAHYREHRPTIALFPDVAPCLGRLPAAVRAAIVSDGPLSAQERKVEALGLARRFAPIVLTDRWGRTYWKPHERAFRTIEVTLGECGAACVYVGDNPAKDFAAPRRLGWRTVRIRRRGSAHAGIDAPGVADSECRGLDELPALLMETA